MISIMISIQLIVFMCMLGVHHAIRHSVTSVDSQGIGIARAEAANESIDSDASKNEGTSEDPSSSPDVGNSDDPADNEPNGFHASQQGSLAEVDNRNYFNVKSGASFNRTAKDTSVSTVAVKDGADVSVSLASASRIPFVDNCEGWNGNAWYTKLKNKSQACYLNFINWAQASAAKVGAVLKAGAPLDLRACSKKEMAMLTATSVKCKTQMSKFLPVMCPAMTDPEFLNGYKELGSDCDTSASEATKELMADLSCEGEEIINPDFSTAAATIEKACGKAGPASVSRDSVNVRNPSLQLLLLVLMVSAPLL